MPALTGACHCGNLRLEVQLTHAPDAYRPRACDCDFCRKHGAAYVSDPQGTLLVRINDEQFAGRYRQGSGLAELLFCRNCGVLIGALYRDDQRLYGVANAKVLDAREGFGPEEPVAPQLLSPGEKMSRWQNLWFADVSVVTEANAVHD
ncbi:MAG TPA: hypothetical protein VED45_06850 [Steroidobacteraceae bacterium]|nr:hypothetical protein [Steroidobacteraceae bacterium]